MELLDDIEIRCDKCCKVIHLSIDDYDFDTCSFDHDENGMGDEIEYFILDEVTCDECEDFDLDVAEAEYARIQSLILKLLMIKLLFMMYHHGNSKK